MTPLSGQPQDGTLLFVYAADSGLFNTVADIAHKIFSPQTYQCRLCALTHGYFKVRETWRTFVATLPAPCLFVHRDQVGAWPGIDTGALPAVYRMHDGRWHRCLAAEVIGRCRDLDQLMAAIQRACLDPG